jgi:hypothetical protein
MACETVAWFLFGGERDDYMFDPGVSQYTRGVECLQAIVSFQSYLKQRRLTVSNKPDWKDAPEWANWLAQDSNGSWYWYQIKPVKRGSFTWDALGRFALAESSSSDWGSSLARRPEGD